MRKKYTAQLMTLILEYALMIFEKRTLAYIMNILEKETGEQNRYRFVEDMMSGNKFREEKDFNYYLNILKRLKLGIEERIKNN
jgi:hypothetical protein